MKIKAKKEVLYSGGIYRRKSSQDTVYKIPIEEVVEDNRPLKVYATKLHCILKRQIIKVVNNQPNDFDADVLILLNNLWNTAYSKGLKHMDIMHAKTDKQ